MKRSIELIGLPVISIEEGIEVGKIRDIILNPQKGEIMGLLVQDEKWWRETKIVSFALIYGIGEYAVTVENISAVASLSSMPEIEELLENKVQAKDSQVITRSGRLVGKVQEYFVELKTGKIEAYELVTLNSQGEEEVILVPASCVLTISRNVVIVIEEVDKYIKKGEVRPAVESWAKILPGEESVTPTLSDTQIEELLKEAEKEISASPEVAPKIEEEVEFEEVKEELKGEEKVEEMKEEVEEVVAKAVEEKTKTPPIEVEVAPPVVEKAEKEVVEEVKEEAETVPATKEVVEEAKPAPEEVVEAEKPAEPAAKKPDLSKIFEERQKKFILGKKTSRKIEDNEGNVIINEGEVITEEIIEKAKSAGKFMELSISVKMEE